jgi:hypothetical protein
LRIVAATTPSTKFPSSKHNLGAFNPRSLHPTKQAIRRYQACFAYYK